MLLNISLPKQSSSTLLYETIAIDADIINYCPICGKSISPKFINAKFTHTAKSLEVIDVASHSFINALFECPDCHNGILVKYNTSFVQGLSRYDSKSIISVWNPLTIATVSPTPIATFPFNNLIEKVSKKFKEIYIQSLQAKLEGKHELVGIGYRKSIEFLVKDYLIYIGHTKSDQIPSMALGDCIKLIDNQKICTLAKASTWLGNDETHYLRKHEDKDINDLEKFLNALVYYITFEITAEEANSFINK